MLFPVEGNIAVGKSTFLNAINTHKELFEKLGYKVVVVLEGVEKWCNTLDPVTGKSILALFYSDQERYGFMFQIEAFSSRVIDLKAVIEMAKDPKTVVIMERSPYSDKYIFAELLHKTGKISAIEHQIYCNLWDLVAKEILETNVTGIIYLYVPPSIALERLHKRNRQGEEGIPLSYLEQLHEQHENFIASAEKAKPVYKIDTSQPIDMNAFCRFVTNKMRLNVKEPAITPLPLINVVDIVALNFSGILTKCEGSRILARIREMNCKLSASDIVTNLNLFDEDRRKQVLDLLQYLISIQKKVCIVSNLYRDIVVEACRTAFPDVYDNLEIHTCRGRFKENGILDTKSDIIGSIKQYGKVCYIDDCFDDIDMIKRDHPDVLVAQFHRPLTLEDILPDSV